MRRKIQIFLLIFLSLYFLSQNLFTISAAEFRQKPKKSIVEGKKWAFCIGISDYRDSGIIDLPKARNDARGLARAIKEHGGFDHVLVLADDLDRDNPQFPSKKNIQLALSRYKKMVKPRDLILFSFSGHGITDPAGRGMLLTADTRLRNLSNTGLPLNDVIDLIKKSGVKKSIILIDASKEMVKREEGRSSHGIYPDRYLRGGITAVFYSARRGFYSYDDQGSDYGVFTSYLIDGLEGKADSEYGGNGDGIVTLRELAAYVQEGVSRWSMERAKGQRPYIRIFGRGMGDLMVSSVEKLETMKAAEKIVERKEPEVIKGKTVEERPKEVERATPKEEIKATIKAEEPARPQRDVKEEIKVGAPAPKIEEIVTEKEATVVHKEKRQEDRKVVEETPAKEEVTVAAKKAEVEKVEKRTEKGILQAEEKKEKPLKSDEVTDDKVQEEGLGEESLKVVSLPPKVVEPEPLYLRKKARNISKEDLRSMLYRYHFYSTCWNYNGDFCNPEGDFENYFVDNRNETVTDKATGLMWQKGGSSKAMTWMEAREYVNKLNKQGFAGYSDWRVPTVEELATLMESSWKNGDLFLDPIFNSEQKYCWSLDTKGKIKAWKANFHLGFFMDFPMTALNSVRLVRSFP